MKTYACWFLAVVGTTTVRYLPLGEPSVKKDVISRFSSAVSSWLASHLDDIELRDDALGDRAVKGSAHYRAHRVRINLYPGAGGKRYTSVILEGEDLPWVSDLDCARSAWRAMDTEIRCSPGDWKEGEPVEDEKWWRLDQRGEQLAVWN